MMTESSEKVLTYGDLLYELELVKGIFRDMKKENAPLEGRYKVLEYLANLQDLRIREDKRIAMLFRLGLVCCDECGSGDITIMEEYDFRTLKYKYSAHCNKCNYDWKTELETYVIRQSERVIRDSPLQKRS